MEDVAKPPSALFGERTDDPVAEGDRAFAFFRRACQGFAETPADETRAVFGRPDTPDHGQVSTIASDHGLDTAMVRSIGRTLSHADNAGTSSHADNVADGYVFAERSRG